MGNIYLTSDLHFSHGREFVYKPRGFNNIEDMNKAIVANFNEVVGEDDDLYICGDLMLGDNNAGIELLKQLKGRIHIVCGNHDTNNRIELYKQLPNVVEIEPVGIKLRYNKYNFVLTHYPMNTGNLERESLKQMTCNFYGHTHQQSNFYQDRPYMYHVGVDSHDCRPVLIDDAIADMENKVKECIEYL